MKKYFIILIVCLICFSNTTFAQKEELNLAVAEIKKMDYNAALKFLDTANQKAKTDTATKAQVHYLRGRCYEKLGKSQEVLKAYKYIIDKAPDTQLWYYAKSRLNILKINLRPLSERLKDLEDAKKSLTKNKETGHYWFAGMIHPPSLSIYLPKSFDVFPGPNTSQPEDTSFNMYSGVFWADKTKGNKYAYISPDLQKLTEPLFFVRLSSDVAQIPNSENFTIEKKLNALSYKAGFKDVVIQKKRFGEYPLLVWSGLKKDGNAFYSAWLGCNSPEGWTILIDYRIPQNVVIKDKKRYVKIWNDFISKTNQK